jgi:tetratricopeptide (TPR) repeat protein
MHLNLSIAQIGLGELAEAEVSLRRAERIARSKGDRANQAMAWNNLGTLMLLQEDPVQAERCLKLAQATRPGLHRAGAMAHGNLGILALLFGDVEQGLRVLQEALPACTELGLHQASACYSTFGAVALHLLGREAEAKAALDSAPKLTERGVRQLQEQAARWVGGQVSWTPLVEGDGEDLRLLHLLRERRPLG